MTGAADLTGLEAEYRWQIPSLGWRVGPLALALAVVFVSVALVDHRFTAALFWGVLLVGNAGVQLASRTRPLITRVRADALLVRANWGPLRTIAWADVEGVRVQDRWTSMSKVALRDGSLVALPGMPAGDAQRLAAALQTR